jgi:DMSO/TMAO reductase YedYZ molybdopterin-dependent catalytic subunit
MTMFSGKDAQLIPYGETNLGMPLELIDGLVVPNALFYVRSNGPTPALDTATWRLSVHGHVERETEIGLNDLKQMPRKSLTAFLECAGNSRSRFEPLAEGTPWRNDAAGNAVWTGTPLQHALDLAGVRAGAVDIVTQGGDMPGMQRGLPLAVAADPETMLVWEMNGQPLLPAHGGPVRLLVPRWAGIASTKWLVGIEVVAEPFAGFWNTENYTLQSAAGERIVPVREMPVKSLISHPVQDAPISAGAMTIAGYAWSGYAAIAKVEVSTDGGATWTDARITEAAGPLSWVRFEHVWQAAPGPARLRSRATDRRGLIQPERAIWNAKGYLNNGICEIAVHVT